jgi:hypothetical protein
MADPEGRSAAGNFRPSSAPALKVVLPPVDDARVGRGRGLRHRGANGTQSVAGRGTVRTVGSVAVGIVVFVLGALAFMLFGAFILRTMLGVARYRDLGLPALVIGGSLLGGAGLGILSFLRLRAR